MSEAPDGTGERSGIAGRSLDSLRLEVASGQDAVGRDPSNDEYLRVETLRQVSWHEDTSDLVVVMGSREDDPGAEYLRMRWLRDPNGLPYGCNSWPKQTNGARALTLGRSTSAARSMCVQRARGQHERP